MRNSEPSIFLSYSWNNYAFADEIDNYFKGIGLTFKRDIREVEYKKSFKEFMQKISHQDFVVLLVSDDYLRSPNCMYEVLELLENEYYQDKILPVILPDTKISRAHDRLMLLEYWDVKAQTLEKSIQNLHEAKDIKGIEEDLVHFKKIANTIDRFLIYLTKLKCMSFEDLKAQDYKPMIELTGFVQADLIQELLEIEKTKNEDDQDFRIEQFLLKHKDNKYGLFLKAYLYSQREKYKSAKIIYENILRLYPAFVEAINDLSVLMDKGFKDYQASNELLKKAIELDPGDFVIQTNQGILFGKLGNFEMAKMHLEKALSINPHFYLAHFSYALLFKDDHKNIELVKEHLEASIKLNQEHVDSYIEYAILLVKHYKLFTEAKVALETAIKLKTNDFKSNHLYAKLLYDNFNDPENSKVYFEKALLVNPDDAEANSDYGVLLINFYANYDMANVHLLKAIELDPQNADIHYNYATLLMKFISDKERSRAHFEQAVRLAPNNSAIWSNYSILLSQQFQDYDNAKLCLENAIGLDPDSYTLQFNYSLLLSAAFGNDILAEKHLKRCLILQPDSFEALMAYSKLLAKRQDYESAKKTLIKAIGINAESSEAYLQLGIIEFQFFQLFDEARKYLEKAVLLDRHSIQAHTLLGSLLTSVFPDYPKAEEYFLIALKNDPHYLPAKHGLALLYASQEDINSAQPIYEDILNDYPDDAFANFMYAMIIAHFGEITKAKKHYKKAIKINSSLRNAEFEENFDL